MARVIEQLTFVLGDLAAELATEVAVGLRRSGFARRFGRRRLAAVERRSHLTRIDPRLGRLVGGARSKPAERDCLLRALGDERAPAVLGADEALVGQALVDSAHRVDVYVCGISNRPQPGEPRAGWHVARCDLRLQLPRELSAHRHGALAVNAEIDHV